MNASERKKIKKSSWKVTCIFHYFSFWTASASCSWNQTILRDIWNSKKGGSSPSVDVAQYRCYVSLKSEICFCCCSTPLFRLLFNERSACGSDYKKCPLCLLICTHAAPLLLCVKGANAMSNIHRHTHRHRQWVSNVQPYASVNAFASYVVVDVSFLSLVCA